MQRQINNNNNNKKVQWDTISLGFFFGFFLNMKNTYLMLNLKSNMLENNYSSQTQTQTLLFKERICIDLLQK